MRISPPLNLDFFRYKQKNLIFDIIGFKEKTSEINVYFPTI